MMEMEEHAEEYETSLKRVQESLQAYPELEIKILPGSTPVSYTHLTLPTIA